MKPLESHEASFVYELNAHRIKQLKEELKDPKISDERRQFILAIFQAVNHFTGVVINGSEHKLK